MRLRLNTTLRAALIAAITTVGYTLGVACAGIQSTDISLWNGYQADSGSAVVGNTGSNVNDGTIYTGTQSWNSSWSHIVTVDAESLLSSDKDLTIYAVNVQDTNGAIGYAEGVKITGLSENTRTITMTSWSSATTGSKSLDLSQYDTLTFVMRHDWGNNGAMKVDVYADGNFEQSLFSASQGGQKFTGYSVSSAETGSTGDSGKFVHKDNKANLPSNDSVGSYSVLAAGSTLGSLPSNDDLNHYYTGITNVFNWNGTDNSDWSSTAENWLKKGATDPVAFTTPYAQAVFGKGDGLSKSVTVTENVAVSTMTVEDNYALVLNANVTADTIRIKSGATLSYSGSGSLTGILDGQGTYALASQAKSMPSGVSVGSGWAGTVVVSNAKFANDLTNINSMGNANSWVLLKGASGWSANNTFNANLILENDGTDGWAFAQNDGNNGHVLVFTGKIKGSGKLGRSNDKGSTYTYAFSGDISEWNGTFEARSKTDHSTTFRVSDNATAVNAALVNASGNLNVDVQTSATFGASVNATKLTVAADKTATFNGAATFSNGVTQDTGAQINVGAEGSLHLGGTVTFGGNAINVADGDAVTWESNVVFNLNGLTGSTESDKCIYTLFTGSDVDLTTLTASNITLTGGAKDWQFGTDGTVYYTLAAKKVWTGNEYGIGNWNYTEANWNGEKFAANEDALFNSAAIVTVTEAVEASSIEVAADSNVLIGTNGDGSLSAASLVIGEGATFENSISIDGLQAFSVANGATWSVYADQTLGAGENHGTIETAGGVTVSLTDASNATDLLLGIEGEGNISLGQSVTIASGEEASMPATKATGTLILEEGVKLQVGNNKDKYASIASFTGVEMKQGAGIDTQARLVEINNLKVTTDDSHTNTIKLLDTYDSTAETVGLDLKGTTTLNGNLKITGDWKYKVNIEKLTGAYSEQTGYSGKLTLTGDNQTHNAVIGEMNIDTLTVENMNLVQLNGATTLKTLSLKKGTTEIASTASVSSLLDLSVNSASDATLTVKNGGALTVGAGAALWGRSDSTILLEEGGIMNLAGMKIVGGTDGGGYIGTTSQNEQYGIGKDTWYISNADITAMDDITVGNGLFACTIDTGAYDVSLTDSTNWLLGATVGAEGSLTMAGGNLDAVITSEGTVTFTGDLAVEGFEEHEGAEGRMDVNGAFTKGTDGNGYAARGDSYITIVDGGDVVADNIAVTQGEEDAALTYYLNNSGSAMREGSGGVTDYSTYYLTSDSVAVSALDDKTTAIEVTGGTVNVDSEYTGDIMVSGEGTIAGEFASPSQVGIAAESAANFVDGIDDTTNGVHYVNDTDAPVVVENTGEDTIHYSIAETDAKVTADNIISDSETEVQVDNQVVVNTIATYGDGTLILSQVDTDTLANIYADMGGSVTLKNVTNATLENLAMNNNTVAVYAGDTTTTEGTVTVTDTLTAGQGTLLANLTLKGGSTLDVDGGDTKALTLGSMLTIDLTEGGLVNLDQTTIDALAGLGEGQSLNLIVAAGQTKLNYGGSYDGVSYDTLFARTEGLTDAYTVYANNGAFGLTKQGAVPEPTTGTLSLLALAALAARRRRK